MRSIQRIRHRRGGFTVGELLIALAVLTIVLGGTIAAVDRGLGMFRQTSTNGDIAARTGRSINRIVSELMGTSLSVLEPDLTPPEVGPYLGSSSIRFRTPSDWTESATVWSETTEIRWQLEEGELDNGADDNGNGLADEGVVVLVRDLDGPNERTVVLARGVSEFLEGEEPNTADDNDNGLTDESGLCFELDGQLLVIRLSLERLGPDGDRIVRTQEVSLGLRN